MESGANSALGLLGLWMWMQLVAFLALMLGGIYALYCLGKAAAGLDRLAAAMEEWVKRQDGGADTTPAGPTPVNRYVPNPSPHPIAPYPTVPPTPGPSSHQPKQSEQPQPYMPYSPSAVTPTSTISTPSVSDVSSSPGTDAGTNTSAGSQGGNLSGRDDERTF